MAKEKIEGLKRNTEENALQKGSVGKMGWLSDTWESVKENASDICHGVLDAAGFIPVFGAIPDVINGCIYAAEGNALDAGMSFAAAIPGVGDVGAVVGKGGKYLFTAGKWLLGKGKKLMKGGGKLLKALKKSKLLGKLAKLGGRLLGKMKVGAKALIKKGKVFFDKIIKKIKKLLKGKKAKTKSNMSQETVTYRRVQGGDGNKSSQQRIRIDENGNVYISKKDTDLNISIDNGEHSQYYIKNKRPGADIYEFEVPKWFDDMVQEYSIPQAGARTNPLNQGGAAPKVTDPTTPGKCVEFPAPWIEWMEEYATNGRIIKGGG